MRPMWAKPSRPGLSSGPRCSGFCSRNSSVWLQAFSKMMQAQHLPQLQVTSCEGTRSPCMGEVY